MGITCKNLFQRMFPSIIRNILSLLHLSQFLIRSVVIVELLSLILYLKTDDGSSADSE